MKTKIYGSSDDLIEIEGAITDEVGCYGTCEKGINFSASDGTKGKITYNGEWEITLTETGLLTEKIVKSNGDDNRKHTDEDAQDCTSYSDVLVFFHGIEWVKIGRKTFKN